MRTHPTWLNRMPDSKEARWRRQLRFGTGRGVRIGLLDTGVADSVPQLGGVIRSHHSVTNTGSVISNRKGEDAIGHGTACAWIVHQHAPEAELHSVRVIGDSPRERGEKLIVGLKFAIEQRWDVINVSLGTTKFQDGLATLADQAAAGGIVIVAAANNDPELVSFPAALSNVIGVDAGSFVRSLAFRYDPNREIEVEASGVYVEAPRPDGSWFHYTGSSFACPHVTAIAARLWESGGRMPERLREKLSLLSDQE